MAAVIFYRDLLPDFRFRFPCPTGPKSRSEFFLLALFSSPSFVRSLNRRFAAHFQTGPQLSLCSRCTTSSSRHPPTPSCLGRAASHPPPGEQMDAAAADATAAFIIYIFINTFCHLVTSQSSITSFRFSLLPLSFITVLGVRLNSRFPLFFKLDHTLCSRCTSSSRHRPAPLPGRAASHPPVNRWTLLLLRDFAAYQRILLFIYCSCFLR